MNPITLYYFHDPMCSWCWGFSNALRELRNGLNENIHFKRILGGLAPDNSETMPAEMQQRIQNTWRRIESSIPGVTFNYDYWQKCQPRRSTYASCRAVIAARQQGKDFDEIMTKAIQNAYYAQARNTSLDSTLIEIAAEIRLDTSRFTQALNSDAVNSELHREILFSRDMDVDSFPSLILTIGDKAIPIALDYTNAENMLAGIERHLARNKAL